MNPTMRDAGAFHAARYGSTSTLTAAGTGDNTEVNADAIDRRGFQSVTVYLGFTATLAATKTLTLSGNLQDCSDLAGTGAADFGDALPATIVATGPGGGGVVKGTVRLGNFNLGMARTHIRAQYTPDLSASGTDTATVWLIYVLGGAEKLPAV